MLYTALHIGDQLISLGGKIVNSSADAQKLIRAWPSLYVSRAIVVPMLLQYFAYDFVSIFRSNSLYGEYRADEYTRYEKNKKDKIWA